MPEYLFHLYYLASLYQTMSTDTIKLATVLQIEKLCSISNYHMWRSLAMTFLHIMEVANIVFGDIPRQAKASLSRMDRTTINDLTTWELASHCTKGFIIIN